MWVPVLLNSVCKCVCCTHVEMCAYLLNVHMCACMCLPVIVKIHVCCTCVEMLTWVCIYLTLHVSCVYLFKCVCINFYLSLYKYAHVSVSVHHADIEWRRFQCPVCDLFIYSSFSFLASFHWYHAVLSEKQLHLTDKVFFISGSLVKYMSVCLYVCTCPNS